MFLTLTGNFRIENWRCAINMRKGTILLLVFLIFVVVLILVEQNSIRTNKQSQSTIAPLPANTETSPTPSNKPQGFSVVKTSLEGKDSAVGVGDAIIIQFSEPVAYDEIYYELQPATKSEASMSQGRTVLTINPSLIWKINTIYSLRINQKTKSESGQNLSSDFVLNFRTVGSNGY